MGILYENLIRPFLFSLEPEKAHKCAVKLLKGLSRVSIACRLLERASRLSRCRPVECFGLKFPNAVGLAAGMDKNAEIWPTGAALGFGHVEIGTVTSKAQPGNPSPRLFRYAEQEMLVNRMGFNNDGAEQVANCLKKLGADRKRPFILGINIGKSKIVELDRAVEDYLHSFHTLANFADYFTINVSSPNTPGLRKLQESEYLPALLGALQEANAGRAQTLGRKPLPLLLKIAPDLSFRQIDAVIQTIFDAGLSGIIATNTTLKRPEDGTGTEEAGGMSGKPLHRASVEIINYIHRATEGKLPIIGVGGIHDAASAGETMDAGASLLQIYTGMIYRGPFFARRLAHALAPRQSNW